MKAVLMSIHPKWCEKIFNGEKTIEVRKTTPKLEMPFTVYVYQTKLKVKKGDSFMVVDALNENLGCGKVIGSFVCDKVYDFFPWGAGVGCTDKNENLLPPEIVVKETCLTEQQIIDYLENGKGTFEGYGLHITEPKLFDKPRELGEFWLYNDELNKRRERDEDFCCYDGTDENGEATTDCDGENINNCYRCWEEWSGLCHKLTRPPQSYCYVEVQK